MAKDYRGTSEIVVGRAPGMLRLGTIIGFDAEILRVQVYIGGINEYGSTTQDPNNSIFAQLPTSHYAPLQKMFVGGYPENGTPVIVGQADGGQWYIVSLLAKDPAAQNTAFPFVPDLESGTFILQNDDTFIKLSQDDGIVLGENGNNITLDTKRDVAANTFDNLYSFSEGARTIEGTILRDTFPNDRYASSLRESALSYNDTLKTIGLDPIAKQNWSNIGSSIRNPSRTEKREVIYEFARSFNVRDDQSEFLSYKDSKNINIADALNRRESRTDSLSLSLVAPNYLMETIKGTAVDIYGNVVDINRSTIPLGKIDKLSIKKVKTNLQEQDPLGNVYENIKKLERREIAYHFEINAKKDTLGPPDVTDRSDYARQRSRFYVDIDKEGLFKLNVPATSETGNIPLLTRYENYSTVTPNDKTKDANDLVFNQNSQDILLESFIGDNAVIKVIDELNGNAAPIDRFSAPGAPTYIKHGTVYHNISNTCSSFQKAKPVYERIDTTSVGTGKIPSKSNIVSTEIKISGDDANGGGRSGSLNFDGSLELNIGANTVDRQSLWVDMQGGMIGNIGRDKRNNISAALNFDGEVLIESGGKTPDDDSRFEGDPEVNNGFKAGAVDIRVYNKAGALNIIRIDNEGISIHSESRLAFYANGDMLFRSTGTITLDGEQTIVNTRKVRRDQGLGSI